MGINSEREKFDNKYDKEYKEIIALTEDSVTAGRSGNDELWKASVKLLAYIDTETNELKKEKVILQWQITEEERKTEEKVFDIKKNKIYRLKVRESLPFTNQYIGKEFPKGAWLMLIEVLEQNCVEETLEKILLDYKKPVVIHPEHCDELLLNKSLGMFCGNGTWNGEQCRINLDVDGEQKECAEDALETLKKLISNCADWDQKARSYAATELTDNANDWQQEDEEGEYEEITEETFAKRLTISEICASLNGDFEIYYEDDDMFFGHVVIVSGNIENGINDATIAG